MFAFQVAEKPSIAMSIASALSGGKVRAHGLLCPSSRYKFSKAFQISLSAVCEFWGFLELAWEFD